MPGLKPFVVLGTLFQGLKAPTPTGRTSVRWSGFAARPTSQQRDVGHPLPLSCFNKTFCAKLPCSTIRCYGVMTDGCFVRLDWYQYFLLQVTAYMRRLALVVWFGLSFSSAVAQAPRAPAFEVVSIHVHPAGQPGKLGFYGSAGGRVELDLLTLSRMVAYALEVDDQRVTGIPSWASDVHYDVKALRRRIRPAA